MNHVKKIPMRMCIVTRERFPKKELLRIVKTEEGIVPDLTGKVNGHGCYIKKDLGVLEKLEKNKILNSVFESEIDPSVYDNIRSAIENG